MDLAMQIASGPNALNASMVIALNVVDLNEYVKKTDLDSMHVMTWGNENTEE